MSEIRDNVGGLRRRLSLVLSARHCLGTLSAGCFAAGIAILVLRSLGPSLGQYHLWPLGLLAVAVGAGVVMAMRQLPSERALRATLDGWNDCGGLVMAAAEVPLGNWADRVGPVRLPRLRWRPWRRSAVLAGAGAFVIVSLIVPTDLSGIVPPRLNVEHQTQRLVEQVKLLGQQEILSEQRGQQIREKLEQIRREADATDPAKTWEALDHVQNQLAQEAAKAAQDAAADRQALAKAQELAGGAMNQGGQSGANAQAATQSAATQSAATQSADAQPSGTRSDPQALTKPGREAAAQSAELTAQMAELAATLQEAMAEGTLASSLSGDPKLSGLLSAARAGSLTPEQMAELAKSLGEAQRQMDQGLMQLADSGMLDAQLAQEIQSMCQGGACTQAGTQPGSGAGNCLDGQCGQCPNCLNGSPGRGGPSRGRGDAPMTWDNGKDDSGVQFKEKALPPGSLASLKDSATIAISRADPTQENAAPAGSGALVGAVEGGGSAYTHQVLPRHRAAVSRFFGREPSGQAPAPGGQSGQGTSQAPPSPPPSSP